MFKIKSIGKWSIFMIFILILLSGSTNADDGKLNDSEHDEDLSFIPDRRPLPDYGPEVFEEIKQNPKFIASRGTMPEIREEEDKREWINSLIVCSSFSNLSMDPYMIGNGSSVVAFGCSIMGGYLYVEFDETTPEYVNESLIDEMYQTIKDHCEQEGISEVPVVFMWGEMPIEAESVEIVEEAENLPVSEGQNAIEFNNSKKNNSESDNDSSSDGNESNKNNSTPGFGLLGSLTCLCGGWKSRKK